MKVLFICTQNSLRSPTAEKVFSGRAGLEVLSAGTAPNAEMPVSADLIEWADVIVAMENYHRNKLNGRFGSLLRDKRIAVLGIPDNYEFMEPALVQLLEDRVPQHLDLHSAALGAGTSGESTG
jgi:predicted protein tyrosine phosphatase